MRRRLLMIPTLAICLLVTARGSVQPDRSANSEFYALSPDADWLVHLSWVNDELRATRKVREMHDASLNLHAAIGSQLGTDSSGRIIFSAEIILDHRARRVIGRFDVNSEKFTVLGDGYGQALVPKSSEILFFKYNERLNDQWLYVASIDEEESLADERRLFPLESYTRLVPIRDHGVAFYDSGTGKAYVYTGDTRKVKEIRSVCSCIPVGYRAVTREWVCKSPTETDRYFLVNERGQQSGEFSVGTPAVPIVYLEGRDSMLFSRVEISAPDIRERINIYEYDFSDKSERLLGKDVSVSPHSISMKP